MDVTVPTGNFGNIFGVIMAKRMGIPIQRVVCASNVNNVLTDFFNTGIYDLRGRKFQQTVSPSIDILISSNLERWLYLLFLDREKRHDDAAFQVAQCMINLKERGYFDISSSEVMADLRSFMRAGFCSETETMECVNETLADTGILIDPHTAVAKHVASKQFDVHTPMVIFSTAHWSKFPETTLESLTTKISDTRTQLDKYKDVPLTKIFEQITSIARNNEVPISIAKLLQGKLKQDAPKAIPANEKVITQTINDYLSSFYKKQ